MFSNRIVGWAIDDPDEGPPRRRRHRDGHRPPTTVTSPAASCIRTAGRNFAIRKVHRALAPHGMVGSMGQVGSAGDNAAMESFFALLQKNVLDRQPHLERPATTSASRSSPGSNAPTTDRRRQRRLGRLTPIEYETIMTPPATLAA